jgi:cysteinyl-tRNA synthetase
VTLRLHDTLTRQTRDFVPLVEGRVGVYVCGPTVQAAPHVGHLRSAVAFDVLHRWLRARGYGVVFVRNVTDIDDKIIASAAQQGVPWWALAERMTRAFHSAYDALAVLPPDAEPRATGHIPQMVALISALMEAGHAYPADGDVYFDVRSRPSYGELSHQSPDALRAGQPAESSARKRDPLDFALWKGAKPGEPFWDMPWGPGRPGWHIECSAMSVEYLGQEFDIHGGGHDLVFPHHENEQAQSRAAGHPFARTWMHHGLVTTPSGEKMSKSLGNSLVVADVLEQVRPPVLRWLLGGAHYRSALEFSPAQLDEAAATYGGLERFVTNALDALGGVGEAEALALEAGAAGESRQAEAAWDAFAAEMDDDLAVPRALAVLHGGVTRGNALLSDALAGRAEARRNLAAWTDAVRRMLGVLALDPVRNWPATGGTGRLEPVVDALVQVALDARRGARERKDYAAADAIRDRLAAAGVAVEDTPAGARWRLAQP